MALFILLLTCVLLSSCQGDSSSSSQQDTGKLPLKTYLTAPENNVRDWLGVEELSSLSKSKSSPYHNDYFLPIGDSDNALHQFNGNITFQSAELEGFPRSFSYKMRQFPKFSAHFVSHQGYLLPENRDIIIPRIESSNWRIILSPGKVWSEPTDDGMTRASFPFTLVEYAWNSALNGVATFVYDDTRISNVRVQIVQQTAPGIIGEAAATVPITFEATPEFNAQPITDSFDDELAAQLPVASWTSLKQEFSSLDWESFNSGLKDTNISSSAIWYNNKVYMQGCKTKFGDYPFCHFMRHGIYSATKPAAGGLALTFLAQRYGSEVFDYLIKDYVNVTSPHTGWNEVRFIDALNMATGIGNNDHDPNSSNFAPDENVPPAGVWSQARSAEEKLAISFEQYGNYPWGPNELFRYNTMNYFVLSAAMDSLVRQREGIGLWQLLKQEVYQPIGIFHSPMMHTTEPDGSRGVPILGVGMYPTVDEMMKISQLFDQLGQYNGHQYLHKESVKKALFRTDDLGFQSHWHNNEDGEGRYSMSFFSVPYRAKEGCLIHVPLLSGAGGNLVTILPNGIIALRFADAQNYNAKPMVDITGELGPLCQ